MRVKCVRGVIMAAMVSLVTDKLLLCHEAFWRKLAYTFVGSINSFFSSLRVQVSLFVCHKMQSQKQTL